MAWLLSLPVDDAKKLWNNLYGQVEQSLSSIIDVFCVEQKLCGIYCNFSGGRSNLWWNINASDVSPRWGEEAVFWKQSALTQISASFSNIDFDILAIN